MNFSIIKSWMLLLIASQSAVFIQARTHIVFEEITAPPEEVSELLFAKPIPKFELNGNDVLQKYEDERDDIIEQEELLATGGHLNLTSQELKVHQIFMRYKRRELSHGFQNPAENAAAMHFFQAKELIERSNVFKFLQEMPKGAILHVHNSAAVSSEWVVGNLTRMPGMLRCINKDSVAIYTFRRDLERHQCRKQYIRVQQERARAKSERAYDKKLEQKINLHSRLPQIEYNTIDKVWSKFQNMFSTIGDMLNYLPAYRAYHWQMMEEMYADKVMYAEIRMRFRKLYADDGATVTEENAIEELMKLIKEFKATHPDFLGIKVIYATSRSRDKNAIKAEFEVFKKFHALYPDFIMGFDLVGQEDKGKTLHSFVQVLQDLPPTAKFFFHAGETNWYGSANDLNLLDAILMNTTRIGHGYGILKHPVLRRAVQNRGIGIEVSPLSNQILNLVWDLRNHPGGFFLSDDVPMVISNDDPGLWGAKALSYDMYYAIMSFAANNAGLKTLKNIVWNSIKYSALNVEERKVAYEQLTAQWNAFVERVLSNQVVQI